jgi:hypothetical protein
VPGAAVEQPFDDRCDGPGNRPFVRPRRRQLVDQEHAPAIIQAAGGEPPEALKSLWRDMRQPGAEEQHVVAAVGPPVEQIGPDEAHAPVRDAAGCDREHLRRAVDRRQRVRVLGEDLRPLPRAAGELEHPSSRRERRQRVDQLPAQRFVGGQRAAGVVLGGARPVVRHLLGEQRLELVSRHPGVDRSAAASASPTCGPLSPEF